MKGTGVEVEDCSGSGISVQGDTHNYGNRGVVWALALLASLGFGGLGYLALFDKPANATASATVTAPAGKQDTADWRLSLKVTDQP